VALLSKIVCDFSLSRVVENKALSGPNVPTYISPALAYLLRDFSPSIYHTPEVNNRITHPYRRDRDLEGPATRRTEGLLSIILGKVY
jgi:hypothetical protein